MGIVKCPDCGKDISDAAPSCLGCGRPMKTSATSTPVKEALNDNSSSSGLVGAFIAVIGLIVGCVAAFASSFILGIISAALLISGARFGAKYK